MKNISEVYQKLDDGVNALHEVRQNLADQDVGDELLTLIDKGIGDIQAAQALLESN